jgi:hypothetical protein
MSGEHTLKKQAIVPIFVPMLFQNPACIHSNPAQSLAAFVEPVLAPRRPSTPEEKLQRICTNPPPASLSIRDVGRPAGAPSRDRSRSWQFSEGPTSGGTSSTLRAVPIRESSKSTSKTVAKAAEQQRRRELEAGFHNIREERQQRIRCLKDIIEEYMEGYRVRYRSPAFAEYALGHVARLLGSALAVDIDSPAVLRYQENRLREGAAPKSINEEVRFLLKMLGDAGEVIRARLRKSKQLKLAVSNDIGKAFNDVETEKLGTHAKQSKSPHIYAAFMLARNAGCSQYGT